MRRQVEAMRALLNHKDPTVAAQGRKMVKASADPAVRALLTNNSRAAAPRVSGGPSRADRAAKSTSTRPGAPLAADVRRAGTGKVDGPGTSSRFAHFAGMSAVAPIADQPALTDITPGDAAAFIAASAAKARGQKPAAATKPPAAAKHDMSTPEGFAAFVAASAAKCRGPSR